MLHEFLLIVRFWEITFVIRKPRLKYHHVFSLIINIYSHWYKLPSVPHQRSINKIKYAHWNFLLCLFHQSFLIRNAGHNVYKTQRCLLNGLQIKRKNILTSYLKPEIRFMNLRAFNLRLLNVTLSTNFDEINKENFSDYIVILLVGIWWRI